MRSRDWPHVQTNFAKQMANFHKHDHFNTTFTSEGTVTDNTSDIAKEYGTRVGVFIMRNGKKEFFLLNQELSTETYKFTELENIFLNFIGQTTHQVNLFDTTQNEVDRWDRMITEDGSYKFGTQHLWKIYDWKVLTKDQVTTIIKGLKKKNVLEIEWYVDPVFDKKMILNIHFTPEFIKDTAAFESQEHIKQRIEKFNDGMRKFQEWEAAQK